MPGCAVGPVGGIPRDVHDTVYKGVNVDEYGRALEFKVFSCMRPWNRAFHASWASFFVAFTGWFAIVPALEYLINDSSNDITLEVAKTSAIVSVLGTILVRFLLGPVCEKFGARRPQAALLIGGGILVMLSSLVNTSSGLIAIRFFIGLVGGAFVPCQYWTMMMFGTRVVGTANAFAGGWGNLGGGFALFFVATMIQAILNGGVAPETAWRYAMLIPGSIMIVIAIPALLLADDCPQGAWKDRLYNDPEAQALSSGPHSSMINSETKAEAPSKKSVLTDYRVWLLALTYAACFGVELTINNSMGSYLFRYFTEDVPGIDCESIEVRTSSSYGKTPCSTLGKDTASQIASLFGLMNLFARALGGIFSDWMFSKMGMKGRLHVLFFTLVGEAIMLMIFSQVTEVPIAITFLVLFSICVQASEGATFALVPFVNDGNIGAVAGIVGAGGNIGAVSWATMLKAIQDMSSAYLYLSFIILVIAASVPFIPIKGEYMFGCGHAETRDDAASEYSEDTSIRGLEFPTDEATAPASEENVSGSDPATSVAPEQTRSAATV